VLRVSEHPPPGVVAEYFHHSVLVTRLDLASIADSPDRVEVDGVRYRATSHIVFQGDDGRPVYHVNVVRED
jgi:hypothetical protein